MAERNIVYLSEAHMITCVLQSGLADEVLDAAKNCGAQGATISYGRGTGIRERMGLMGVTIDEQKEVIRIMRNALKKSSYILWRKRVRGRPAKHRKLTKFRLLNLKEYKQYNC